MPAPSNTHIILGAGGRQGLKELQLHPESFDGVLAGAPAWWTSHLQPWTAKLGSYNLPVNASHHIPPTLFPVIAAEVLRQCDGSDDVEDGIISDPARCNFYPEALLCSAANTNASSCLTAPQISTLYQIYNDYVDTNQTFVFPALPLGSEPQWPVLLGGSSPHPLGTQYVQYFLLNDPNWRWQDISYRIVELADQLDPGKCQRGQVRNAAETQACFHKLKARLYLKPPPIDSKEEMNVK